MCRHLAYVGPPIALADALWRAPHALVRQASAPQHQVSGDDNPDGWGVAWYDDGVRLPRRYRTATRMWEDTTAESVVGAVRSGAFVAAARLASPGAPIEESGNAPFIAGPWTFSLNGFVADFTEGAGEALRGGVGGARLASIEGEADTEVLFAMVLDRIEGGAQPRDALVDTVAAVETITTGRLNCILHDGRTIFATVVGNSLFARPGWVASEPLDDDGAWAAVPDRSTIVIRAGTPIHVEPLWAREPRS